MKIKVSDLRKIIKEEVKSAVTQAPKSKKVSKKPTKKPKVGGTQRMRPTPPSATTQFTEEELQTIYSILHNTWNVLADDCLQANEGQPMSRDEVIQVTLDANYADMYGCISSYKNGKAIWKKYDSLPYEEMIKIAEQTFKSARYV